MKKIIFALIICLSATSAMAVNPDEVLKDPVLEARARDISKGLRCLVCQNQSIDNSNAALARDLRILVRERLVAGDSNDQVIDYVVSRYGDFVLLRPPFKSYTLVLWLGPLAFAGLGLFAVIAFYRRQKVKADNGAKAAPPPLSADEQRRLNAIMNGDA